ncbi:MAG TPA: GTP cyclohydrolase I [Anaeromyxobacter sp.]|nr:GTP cyclohydrolase I [Anaeromyxobacter sp.]
MAARPRARPRPLGVPQERPAALAAAVSEFLDALGLPAEARSSGELAGTPARVAQAWLEELLDGYGADPAAILAQASRSEARALVALTGIEYHSVCPHHLLPSRGVAHVGYLPGGRLVGFGQLVQLVDALAHRLVLQEDLAQQIAAALVEHLGARGAGCVLDAEHLCLTVRGERRTQARAHAEGWAGVMARDPASRRGLLAAMERAGAGRARGKGKGKRR